METIVGSNQLDAVDYAKYTYPAFQRNAVSCGSQVEHVFLFME